MTIYSWNWSKFGPLVSWLQLQSYSLASGKKGFLQYLDYNSASVSRLSYSYLVARKLNYTVCTVHSGGGVIVPRKKSERNAGRTVIYQNWSRSHLLIPTPILCNNQCALQVRESITIPVLECEKDVKNHRKNYLGIQ